MFQGNMAVTIIIIKIIVHFPQNTTICANLKKKKRKNEFNLHKNNYFANYIDIIIR